MINNYTSEYLWELSVSSSGLSLTDALAVLDPCQTDLMSCLMAAYTLRKKYFGHEVTVHILNNVQNGLCSEDCHYCAQSRDSKAPIEKYSMKSDQEIMAEAKAAYEQGAHRYCMVFSGTKPSDQRVDKLVDLIGRIKSQFPIEVCVSAGIVSDDQARKLKSAGLDRLNHNINTSERFYSRICSTHSFQDRVNTLNAAKKAGLAVCSGVIVGMGESREDIFEMAAYLRRFQAESIPVNFYLPLDGARIQRNDSLSPDYCLRILCLFRLMIPAAEIRMAAGREQYLRSLEVFGLYAANSLFLQGYLNAQGASNLHTLQMIKDAGFTIKSEVKLDDLLTGLREPGCQNQLKSRQELRPFSQ